MKWSANGSSVWTIFDTRTDRMDSDPNQDDLLAHLLGRREAAFVRETETAQVDLRLPEPFVFTRQPPLAAKRAVTRLAAHPAEPVGGGGKRFRRCVWIV